MGESATLSERSVLMAEFGYWRGDGALLRKLIYVANSAALFSPYL